MGNRNVWTKILAIAGSVLVWLPIIAPIVFSVPRLLRAPQFSLDYLMPAELFPVVLVGGALLVWAAVRARTRRALIGGALGAAVALLVGGQALAVVTGLASGETEPVGLPWAVVVTTLLLYDAAVVSIGIGGALLLRELLEKRSQPMTA